ncbi:MAG: DUF2652 domain-containing protein [Chloroflexi bacterium]|nr:DUF2652 domain-containing protein [Chloroflexota bacterium]
MTAESASRHGYLLLADISGYTSYVAGTELDHAQQILSDLLETIIEKLTSVLTLSKLEGDAVFCYTPESHVQRGETVLEVVESAYYAFRDRAVSMRRSTTCTCKACSAIPTLDLKFIAHHGDFILQSVANRIELIGSDVNLVHRLLKNHVAEATGWRGYALFTERCLEHMGTRPDELRSAIENYEHLGDVQTHCMDLHPMYERMLAQRRVQVTPQEALYTYVGEFDAPPPVVWDWLNDVQCRGQWMPYGLWSAFLRPGGRRGAPGARNHCAHGKGVMVETVLDWRPFEYVTVEAIDLGKTMRRTIHFEPLDGGTRTRTTHFVTAAKLPLPRLIMKPLFARAMETELKYTESFQAAAAMLKETYKPDGPAA